VWGYLLLLLVDLRAFKYSFENAQLLVRAWNSCYNCWRYASQTTRNYEWEAARKSASEMLPNTIRAIIPYRIAVNQAYSRARTAYVSRTCTSTRNRCNNQSINISKIYLRLSMKSILRSPTTAISFHRARRAKFYFYLWWCSMWQAGYSERVLFDGSPRERRLLLSLSDVCEDT